MREHRLSFYNLDNHRPPGQVADEIRAMLSMRPAVLGLCEATYNLVGVAGYLLLRDTSTPGRANVAAYVKTTLEVDAIQWHDLEQTWTRTNPGATGQHPPRSILEFRAGAMQVLVAHQPPKGTDNVKPSQQEGIDKLTARMAPWTRDDWTDRPADDKRDAKAQARVVIWDANRTPYESGPGPTMLASKIGGDPVGSHIDGAVIRAGRAKMVRYPSQVDGVQLCSDHGCAFTFVYEIAG